MNDLRRLNELRTGVRASYYACRRGFPRVTDARLRAVLEDAALTRWRLARSIDAFLVSQPAEEHSRLGATPVDLAHCLALRARTALASDRNLYGLRWLASDSAQLRHAVEICRALSWSLEVSDFLSARLVELKQVQCTANGLLATMPTRRRVTVAGGRTAMENV